MNSEDARQRLEALKIGYSEDNFFKYVQSGDRELVEIFLDAGFPPGARNEKREAAVSVASKAGKPDIARVLLNRGASAEPLLDRPPQGKDVWDKISASSGILSFISGILIAAVGGYFTYSYNQRQMDLNRTQSEHDALVKEQSNKVLELDAVQKLIPTLTSSKDERGKTAALIAIQDLAHPELAAHLAVLFKGQGSVQYLKQAASSGNANTKEVAIGALSTIATSGTASDFQMASNALYEVFENTRNSIVQVETTGLVGTTTVSGVVISANGYVLTVADVDLGSRSAITVRTADGGKFVARLVKSNKQLGLALFAVEALGLTPVRVAATPVKPSSSLITIVDRGSAYTIAVFSVDENFIYFPWDISSSIDGGPLLGTNGELVGLVTSRQASPGSSPHQRLAIRSDVILKFLGPAASS